MAGFQFRDSGMAQHFRIPNAPRAASALFDRQTVSALRLRVDSPQHGYVTAPSEDAYVISYQLREVQCHDLFLGEKCFPGMHFPQGSVCFVNMAEQPSADFESEFDIVQFHVPHSALRALAEDRGLSSFSPLRCPPLGTLDPIIGHLAACLLPSLTSPLTTSSLFVDHVFHAFQEHLVSNYGEAKAPFRRQGAELAPWQKRRALEMLSAGSDENLLIAEVARECRLSVSHFTRAFHRSVGMPPHRWLNELRIKRAKELLRQTSRSLEEVALDCGFKHRNPFARAFSRVVGTTPGRWRRMHRE